MDKKQQRIALGEGEASYSERKNELGLALIRVECDAEMSRLVLWVFDVTHGGRDGQLIKSYKELAQRPYGLCCSVSKARSTVSKAVSLGLLAKDENRYVSNGQRANGYSIDWAGVSRLLKLETRPGVPRGHPPVSTEHPPVSTEHPPVSTEHPFREQPSSPSSTLPDPEPEGPRPLPEDVLILPDMRELSELIVSPLPPGRLIYGAFAVIQESRLSSPESMSVWFRKQLSLPRPVCGNTQAHLALVLASARHAIKMRSSEIRQNRCAVFVGIIHHCSWKRVARHLPESIDQLRALPDDWLIADEDVLQARQI